MTFNPVFRAPFKRTFSDTSGVSVPILYVQSAKITGSGLSLSCAYSGANTAGSLLVVSVSWAIAAASVASVVDTNGNTYNQVSGRIGGGGSLLHNWYAMNCIAGANTVTVNLSVVSTVFQLAIHEYSGIALVNALDKSAGTGGTGTTADSGATLNTAQNNELLFGAARMNGVVANLAAGAGYDAREITDRHITEDQIVSMIGAYNATATWTTSRTWACQIATFKGITP